MEKKKNSSAVGILHRRYIQDNAQRIASIQEERVNAHVARTIRQLREEAELSPKELAELIGTTQSAISRLEDADYDGHSLSMLDKIARALNQRIRVLVTSEDESIERLRNVFRQMLRDLRIKQGLTPKQLAEKLEMDQDEIISMEQNPGYRPPSAALRRLSQFYQIPFRRLATLAGAASDVAEEVREEASQYAARSESFAKLTREQRQLLDQFVSFLKKEK
jgi:transcriptional regulator with XRE-family HTH domain